MDNKNENLSKNLQSMKLNSDIMPNEGKRDEEEDDDSADDGNTEELVREYSNLETALDEINSYMDELEKKNDKLFADLKLLLSDNIQTRKELEKSRSNGDVIVDQGNINSNSKGSDGGIKT